MTHKRKALLFLLTAAVAGILLTACSGGEEEDMTLQNENWDDISLSGKDNPTVLFHFTGVD
ncbi:hypothetical protein D7Z54_22980 [Salibacterium salarium]|uniref:AhpC/TSA family protein n=1 Tax=Salibacterium salarium TaxID=284579 RepID=A0A428MY18_9BACI|nr:hypothetical protein [Salibacterium salarium]RSL31012.1 hypothetical protein D7Z54_22980 [Salibacterium salarium]